MARSLQVKTLKGESFQIEVAPEAVVSKGLIHAAVQAAAASLTKTVFFVARSLCISYDIDRCCFCRKLSAHLYHPI